MKGSFCSVRSEEILVKGQGTERWHSGIFGI
jgi:hypothetical protein